VDAVPRDGVAADPRDERATVGLGVVLAVLAAVGVLSPADVRGWALAFCGPACLVMLPVMLLRLGMYTGRTGEHAHHGAPPAG
jgi:hypothetical protein